MRVLSIVEIEEVDGGGKVTDAVGAILSSGWAKVTAGVAAAGEFLSSVQGSINAYFATTTGTNAAYNVCMNGQSGQVTVTGPNGYSYSFTCN